MTTSPGEANQNEQQQTVDQQRSGDQQEQQNQNSQDQGESGNSGESGGDNQRQDSGNAGGGDGNTDFEALLDAERAKNIKLRQQLDAKKQDDEDKNSQASEQEKEYKRALAENKRYKDFMATTFLENAILKDNKYEWQSVEDVRAFLNQADIRIDMESGSVEGLDLELKRIAKAKPYLLKPKKQDEQGQGPSGSNTGARPFGRPASGSHPSSTQTNQTQADRDRIKAKYKIGQSFLAR